MPHLSPSRVLQTSTSTGSSNITLGAAVTGYRSLADVGAAAADTAYLLIEAVDGDGRPTGQWEIALCTAVSASEWARTTLITRSTGFDGNFAAGTKRVSAVLPGQRVGRTRVSIFNVPGGTLALLPETIALEYVLIGAGGGGAAGRRGAASSARTGGGGGGGGGITRGLVQRSLITGTLVVNVGAASVARAAAPATNDTSGPSGISGGDTWIEHGSVVLALAGGGRGGGAGGAGSSTGVAGAGGSGLSSGGNGGFGNLNTSGPSIGQPGGAGGGGSGGSISTGNSAAAGQDGGIGSAGAAAGVGGAAGTGAAGTNAVAVPAGVWLGGSGGGGGAANAAGGGGAGANGAFPGGGGGGAAASLNGFQGGDGGLGADGIAIIIEHF